MTLNIACIGARSLPQESLLYCEEIGEKLVSSGFAIHTGNAQGADQAFARGGNKVDPSKVTLHLPWFNYNKQSLILGNKVFNYPFEDLDFYESLASSCHPVWNKLSSPVKKLHTRNASIICPSKKPVDICIAWPSKTLGKGGTGLGMRIAEKKNVDLYDLNETPPEQILQWLNDLKG